MSLPPRSSQIYPLVLMSISNSGPSQPGSALGIPSYACIEARASSASIHLDEPTPHASSIIPAHGAGGAGISIGPGPPGGRIGILANAGPSGTSCPPEASGLNPPADLGTSMSVPVRCDFR